MLWFLFATLFILWLAAALLILDGWRGRRMNDHPVCRRCRYDLSGTAAPAACPECGSDLLRRRAVRHGVYERQPRLLATGLTFLSLGAAGAAGLLYEAWPGNEINWARHKPTWWLVSEATGSGVDHGTLGELSRRQLTDDQVERLKAHAFALQRDPNRPWHPAWTPLVEHFHDRGDLTPDEWAQFLRASLSFRLETRPRVRHGDPVPIRIVPLINTDRHSTRRGVGATVTFYREPLRIGDRVIEVTPAGEHALRPVAYESPDYLPTQAWEPDEAGWTSVGDGPQRCSLTVHAAFSRPSHAPETLTYKLEADLTVLPRDRPSVRAIDDAQVAEAAVASAEITMTEVSYAWSGAPAARVSVSVSFANSDVPIAADVLVCDSDRIITRLTPEVWLTERAGGGLRGWIDPSLVSGLDRVDLVLRPNAAVAAKTVSLSEYLENELILRRVPILRPPPLQAGYGAAMSPPQYAGPWREPEPTQLR